MPKTLHTAALDRRKVLGELHRRFLEAIDEVKVGSTQRDILKKKRFKSKDMYDAASTQAAEAMDLTYNAFIKADALLSQLRLLSPRDTVTLGGQLLNAHEESRDDSAAFFNAFIRAAQRDAHPSWKIRREAAKGLEAWKERTPDWSDLHGRSRDKRLNKKKARKRRAKTTGDAT